MAHPFADDPIERERCPYCGTPGRLFDIVDGRSYWRCEWLPCVHRARMQDVLDAEQRDREAGNVCPDCGYTPCVCEYIATMSTFRREWVEEQLAKPEAQHRVGTCPCPLCQSRRVRMDTLVRTARLPREARRAGVW